MLTRPYDQPVAEFQADIFRPKLLESSVGFQKSSMCGDFLIDGHGETSMEALLESPHLRAFRSSSFGNQFMPERLVQPPDEQQLSVSYKTAAAECPAFHSLADQNNAVLFFEFSFLSTSENFSGCSHILRALTKVFKQF